MSAFLTLIRRAALAAGAQAGGQITAGGVPLTGSGQPLTGATH